MVGLKNPQLSYSQKSKESFKESSQKHGYMKYDISSNTKKLNTENQLLVASPLSHQLVKRVTLVKKYELKNRAMPRFKGQGGINKLDGAIGLKK